MYNNRNNYTTHHTEESGSPELVFLQLDGLIQGLMGESDTQSVLLMSNLLCDLLLVAVTAENSALQR